MSKVFDCATGETVTVPDPVITQAIPQSVTRRQARLALLNTGLLSTVDSAIAALPGVEGDAARIEWADALEFNRSHPLVVQIAETLGLSEAQIDALFVAAAAL